jgi:hypothetical protein
VPINTPINQFPFSFRPIIDVEWPCAGATLRPYTLRFSRSIFDCLFFLLLDSLSSQKNSGDPPSSGSREKNSGSSFFTTLPSLRMSRMSSRMSRCLAWHSYVSRLNSEHVSGPNALSSAAEAGAGRMVCPSWL